MNSAEQYEAVVTDHYEQLFRFALILTQSDPGACDLTQQTFCVWAAKGLQLQDTAKVKTWLFTTMHRGFLAAHTRQLRFSHCLNKASHQNTDCSPRVTYQTDLSLVVSALGRVDEIYQGAVTLFYLDDFSYNDIATILDVPLDTVNLRLVRGLAQLREIMMNGNCSDLDCNGDGIAFGHTNKPIAPSWSLH